MITHETLRDLGQGLYGATWKTALAHVLSMSISQLAQGLKGTRSLGEGFTLHLQLLRQSLTAAHTNTFAAHKAIQLQDSVLIQGDCRNITLPKVDVILTDPVWPNALKSLVGSDNPERLFREAMEYLTRFLNPKGRIIVQLRCDSNPHILKGIASDYPFVRLVWLPYAIPSRQGRILISGDVGYIYGTPPKSTLHRRLLPGQPHADFCPPAQTTKAKAAVRHPCPRNLTHVEWLVERFTQPDEVILDPFMGSGTTAIAALRRGRKFIGIEIERKFWLEAQRRVLQEYVANPLYLNAENDEFANCVVN